MKLEFSQTALKNLRTFDQTDQRLIITKLHYLCDHYEMLKSGKKVRELVNTEYGRAMRYTVNRKIRVIFKEESDRLVLMILRVGLRSNVHDGL